MLNEEIFLVLQFMHEKEESSKRFLRCLFTKKINETECVNAV